MFRYRLVENFASSKVKLAIGQVSVEARVSPHPLFDQAQKIFIKKDELNLKCLELLQKGQVEIAPERSSQFVKKCKSIFQIEPQLIVEEVGLSIMLSNSEQQLKNLDYIDFNDLLSVIKIGFDKTAIKLHPKIMRKLKNYILNCKRTESQKNIISQILKSLKQNQKIQDDQQQVAPVRKEVQKQTKTTSYKDSPKTEWKPAQQQNQKPAKNQVSAGYISNQPESRKDKRQNQRIARAQQREDEKQQKQQRFLEATSPYENKQSSNKQKWQNNNYNNKRQGRSTDRRSNEKFGRQQSKQKYDPKVLLGISGDTQAGWRQRNRPPRVPVNSNKSNIDNYKHSGYQKKQWKKQDKSNSYVPKKELSGYQQSSSPQQTFKPVVTAKSPSVPAATSSKKPASQGSKSIDNGAFTLAFTYPGDGNQFNFGTVKDNFKMLVNDSFWITFSKGNLQIKKGDNGYARQSKIDVISNGFMAEGLTLNLQGYSNIEDGGDMIGNPHIQDFTGSQKQFFHVNKLEVYSGEQDKNSKTAVSASPTKVTNLKDFQAEQQEQLPKQKQPRANPNQNLNQQQQEQEQIEPYQKKKSKRSQKVSKAEKEDKPKRNKRQNYKQNQEDGFEQYSQNTRKISNASNNSKKSKKQKKPRRQAQKDGTTQEQNQQDWQDVDQKSQASNPSNKSASRRGQKKREIRQKYQKQDRQFGGHDNQLKPSKDNGLGSRRYDNKSRSKSNSRSKYEQKGKSRDKIKYDPKILLGINGNSEQGWRQINRPSRAPAKNYLQTGEQQDDQNVEPRRQKSRSPRKYVEKNQQKQDNLQQPTTEAAQVKKQQVKKDVISKDLTDYKLIFSYPKDGKTFDFNKVKDNFKMFVNESFWINFKDLNLQILKGEDGYLRDSKIDVMKDSFIANGLTVSLDGSSNLEDGGEQVGSPQIEQFTKNKSQFFHIDTLSVYAPISK